MIEPAAFAPAVQGVLHASRQLAAAVEAVERLKVAGAAEDALERAGEQVLLWMGALRGSFVALDRFFGPPEPPGSMN